MFCLKNQIKIEKMKVAFWESELLASITAVRPMFLSKLDKAKFQLSFTPHCEQCSWSFNCLSSGIICGKLQNVMASRFNQFKPKSLNYRNEIILFNFSPG